MTNHLALGIFRNIDGIGTSAWSTTHEVIFASRRPAAMANIGLVNLAGVGVCGASNNHTEALEGSISTGEKRIPYSQVRTQ